MFMLCKTLQAAYRWQEVSLRQSKDVAPALGDCLLAVLENMPDSNNIIQCWISNACGSIKLWPAAPRPGSNHYQTPPKSKYNKGLQAG